MLFNNGWRHSHINSILLDLNTVFICGVSLGNDFMHDVSIHEIRWFLILLWSRFIFDGSPPLTIQKALAIANKPQSDLPFEFGLV